MKDPRPLLDDGATALELTLLQAGDADGPSPQARQAALAALGLGGALLAASSPAAATAGGTAVTSGARLLAVKWWVVGALVTASGAAGLGYAARQSQPAPVSRSSAVLARQPAPPVLPISAAPSPPAADPTPSPSVASPLERPPAAPARAASSAGNPSIEEQIALVERARSAVANRKPAAALAALDEYQRRFPAGVLGQEATLLRIETLLASGDKATATRLGRRFLERYPRSPMAARVKTLIEG